MDNNELNGEPDYASGPMPPKAHAALYIIKLFGGKDDKYSESRELSKLEQTMYDSACKLLNQWFLGEMDLEFNYPKTSKNKRDDGDDPKVVVPV